MSRVGEAAGLDTVTLEVKELVQEPREDKDGPELRSEEKANDQEFYTNFAKICCVNSIISSAIKEKNSLISSCMEELKIL